MTKLPTVGLEHPRSMRGAGASTITREAPRVRCACLRPYGSNNTGARIVACLGLHFESGMQLLLTGGLERDGWMQQFRAVFGCPVTLLTSYMFAMTWNPFGSPGW